ncbi:MAG: djlA [Francisellaceae bacterium]|nr:djlA [Francisellaceae bacterium]
MFLGKLLGFMVGSSWFGLIGGLIGLWFGHQIDKTFKSGVYNATQGRSASIQQTFFKATFSIMGHLAKADGHVSENEIKVARQSMRRLGLTETLKKEAIRLFNEGKSYGFNLNSALDNLLKECRYHKDLLNFFIEMQLEAALADGSLGPQTRKILLQICERLGYSQREFEILLARYRASQAFHEHFQNFQENFNQYNKQSHQGYYQQHNQSRTYNSNQTSLTEAYGVLGVKPSDPEPVIKKAYRRLVNQHHPDKLASKGLPLEMMKVAERKTQQIITAYEVICKSRGF